MANTVVVSTPAFTNILFESHESFQVPDSAHTLRDSLLKKAS